MRFFPELEQKALWKCPKWAVLCAFSCLEYTISKSADFYQEDFKKTRLKEIPELSFLFVAYTVHVSWVAKACPVKTVVDLPSGLQNKLLF